MVSCIVVYNITQREDLRRNTVHLPETQGKLPCGPPYDTVVTGLPEFSEGSCLLVSGDFQTKSLLDCICCL